MRLLNDADFAESNHFFKATRLFIAQAAQQSAHAAELTEVRFVVPPPFPSYDPISAHAAELTRARRKPPQPLAPTLSP